MYTFLVLGIIPGTDIAISFQAWLVIAGLVIVVGLIFRSPMRHAWESGRQAARLPLPASRLHLRTRQTAR